MSDNPTATEGTEGTVETPVVTDKPLEPAGKVYDETYVKGLRDEAANARVTKRDAVDAAKAEVKAEYEAKLAEASVAHTETQNELAATKLELEKLYVTLDAKVPSDKVRAFAEILKGSDAESLAASVESNMQLFGGFDTKSPAVDPTRGTGGRKDIPLNGDPILAAITAAINRK